MFRIWRYENHISGVRVSFFAFTCDLAVAFENIDFVFPVVRMKWRMTLGFDFEESHGKIRCSITFFD